MAYQDDYVMRTITDLVRAIAGLALGKNEIDYDLPLRGGLHARGSGLPPFKRILQMQETLTGLRMSCMNVWIPVTGRIWKWLWHFICI